MKLRPLFDGVVVREQDGETRTPSGLVLPDNATKQFRRGEVLAVGPGGYVDGHRVEPEVRPGDVVIWSAPVFTIDVDGEKLVVVQECTLLGVLEP